MILLGWRRGKGWRQVGTIPGKQYRNKCWGVCMKAEPIRQRVSGVKLHKNWLDRTGGSRCNDEGVWLQEWLSKGRTWVGSFSVGVVWAVQVWQDLQTRVCTPCLNYNWIQQHWTLARNSIVNLLDRPPLVKYYYFNKQLCQSFWKTSCVHAGFTQKLHVKLSQKSNHRIKRPFVDIFNAVPIFPVWWPLKAFAFRLYARLSSLWPQWIQITCLPRSLTGNHADS